MSTETPSPEISKPTLAKWSKISCSSGEFSWGTGFAQFALQAEAAVLERAALVLEPWSQWGQGPLLGRWVARPQGDCWKLESPSELADYLSLRGHSSVQATVDEVVRAVEFQATALAVLDQGSPAGFHGALMSRGASTLGLVGAKGAGKSTLAAALWQVGWSLYSDDGFFFEQDGRQVSPVPRRSRLRPASSALFCQEFLEDLRSRASSFVEDDGSLLYVTTPWSVQEEGRSLNALVLLDAEPGPLQRVTEADAVLAFYPHLYRHDVDGVPRTLRRLAPLVGRVPCYRLGRGPLKQQLEILQGLPS
jgi:hypothetical protein